MESSTNPNIYGQVGFQMAGLRQGSLAHRHGLPEQLEHLLIFHLGESW